MSRLFPLHLRDVTVRRQGRPVLGPLDLRLDPTRPVMVVGPNGSGKTTLLRVMHGVERVTGGEVSWSTDDPARHAFVFQSPIVLRRSVADNIAYPLRLARVDRPEVVRTVDHWLARTGLAPFRDSPARRLSGGERQKLAIARALTRRPDVLFLDEPCANLDGHATREIEALLLEAAAQGTQIIMATHNMGQARRLAGEVVFMLDGKVHEQGGAERLETPKTEALAAFLRGDIVT